MDLHKKLPLQVIFKHLETRTQLNLSRYCSLRFCGKINIEKHKEDGILNIVGFSNSNKKDNPNAPDVILYYSAPMASSGLDLDAGVKASVNTSQPEESSKPAFEDESPDF